MTSIIIKWLGRFTGFCIVGPVIAYYLGLYSHLGKVGTAFLLTMYIIIVFLGIVCATMEVLLHAKTHH